MKIYKNPWVSYESYFVKTGAGKSAKMEAAKSEGYSLCFLDGRWILRKSTYYNYSLSRMPVIVDNRVSFRAELDKAIVNIILAFVESSKKAREKEGYRICPASHMEITDDDFCSYGERKEND